MIQILKQRKIEREGIVDHPMMFYSKQDPITSPTLPDLFYQLDEIINRIPESERYNLHYTLCECDDHSKPRIFARQNIIPFDIDKCDTSRLESYIEPICNFLQVSPNDVGIVSSGNGLHILVACEEYWDSKDYFVETKDQYLYLAKGINTVLSNYGLPGKVDSALWSAGHTLRLPSTRNIKGEVVKECVVINRIINTLPVTIKSLAGQDTAVPAEATFQYETKPLGGHYAVDNHAVLNECQFLVHCHNHQDQVSEPQWRAMLSILSRLEGGTELCHEYSKNHPNYTYELTEQKIEHVKATSKPYLCKTIEQTGFDCSMCKWKDKCSSPITIKGENFIGTKTTGFRTITIDKNNNPKPGKVHYNDLVKYFAECHDYRISDSKTVYIWRGTHWDLLKDIYIQAFVEDNVVPSPSNTEVNEFLSKLYRTNIKSQEWFNGPEGYFNLSNGILDFKTQTLIPHSKDYGFQYCADFAYDVTAKCPRWDRYIDEVTLDRQELKDALMEYAGYVLSGMDCRYSKTLILTGGGSNGKSKYTEVMQGMITSKAFTTFTMDNIGLPCNLAEFQGKLVNISDETPKKSFLESSVFKTLTTGGTVQARRLYKDPAIFTNKSKMILLANDIPGTDDSSFGFRRRLLIVPFDGQWIIGEEGTEADLLDKLLLEKSGILNWMIKGYLQLIKRGYFAEVGAIKESLEEYINESDPLHNFCQEWLNVEPLEEWYEGGKAADFNEIYAHYVKYCNATGIKFIPPSATLGKRMKHQIKDYHLRKYRAGGGRQGLITKIKNVTIVPQAEF